VAALLQIMCTGNFSLLIQSEDITHDSLLKFHNTLNVRTLAKRELHGSTSSSTVDSLVTHLGHLFKLRKMNLNMQDKRDFLAFYEARNKKKSA
jgi:hypothetical protein